MSRALRADRTTPASAQPALFTRTFAIVSAVGFLAFAHSQALTPIIPLYVVASGGDVALVGIVAGTFGVTSFALRPLVGRAVDEWSVRGVSVAGTAVLGIASLAYLIYHPALLLVTRAVHGLGWAAFNTAGFTLVAQVAPPERRGEASGYYSMWQGFATVVMPGVALWLLAQFGFSAVFVFSAALGLLSAATAFSLPETHGAQRAGAAPGRRTLFEGGALLAMVFEISFKITNPALQVFIPLYAVSLGIPLEQLTYYYVAYGLTIVVGRSSFGRVSDRFGRGPAIVIAAVLAMIGIAFLVAAQGIGHFVIGGTLYQLGSSIATPAIMALAIDRSDPARRGSAMATYSMGFQIAFSAGSFLWGLAAARLGLPAMYMLVIATQFVTIALVLAHRTELTRSAQTAPARGV